MPNIIHHDPRELYRVDVTIGDRHVASVHFDATDAEVTDTARRIVAEQGGDSGDVYLHTGADRGSYYDTVGVE